MDALEISCAHEARHSTASLILGLPLKSAKIDALGGGEVTHRDLSVTADNAHNVCVMILVGALDEADWPPVSPSRDGKSKDERTVASIVEHHGIDYEAAVNDAITLSARADFVELEERIAGLLAERGYLGAETLRKALEDANEDDEDIEGERDELGCLTDRALDATFAREQAKRVILATESYTRNGNGTKAANTMQHLTLKTVVTQTTDQGLVEAVISTASADRENDTVEPRALVNALAKWNRPIPLAWAHETKRSQDIFGAIDPASVRESNGEVIVRGQVDFDSEQGRDAWRLVKSRVIGFSYGYLQLSPSPRTPGGGNRITALDVFEITATPTPMNNETRVLETKQFDDFSEVIARADAEHSLQRKHAAPIVIHTFAA